jgi:hypothetical protein
MISIHSISINSPLQAAQEEIRQINESALIIKKIYSRLRLDRVATRTELNVFQHPKPDLVPRATGCINLTTLCDGSLVVIE